MEIKSESKYTKEHEWLSIDGNTAYIGITDFAQSHLGDIVYIDLPDVDDKFEKGECFSVIDSIKASSDVYIPFSVKILEINENLEDSPELLNESPYENWIIKVEILNKEELDELITAIEYEEICAGEEE